MLIKWRLIGSLGLMDDPHISTRIECYVLCSIFYLTVRWENSHGQRWRI
jgi:hypothetical protein